MEIKGLIQNFIAVLVLQGNVVKAITLTWLLCLTHFAHAVLVWLCFGEVARVACWWV